MRTSRLLTQNFWCCWPESFSCNRQPWRADPYHRPQIQSWNSLFRSPQDTTSTCLARIDLRSLGWCQWHCRLTTLRCLLPRYNRSVWSHTVQSRIQQMPSSHLLRNLAEILYQSLLVHHRWLFRRIHACLLPQAYSKPALTIKFQCQSKIRRILWWLVSCPSTACLRQTHRLPLAEVTGPQASPLECRSLP